MRQRKPNRKKAVKKYGTFHGICVYSMWDQDFVRKASSLVGNGERVKTEAVFKNTMQSAHRLAAGSRLASAVYALLPPSRKSDKFRRQLVGKAVRLLKEGHTATAVVVELMIAIRPPKRNRRKKAVVKPLRPVAPVIFMPLTRLIEKKYDTGRRAAEQRCLSTSSG